MIARDGGNSEQERAKKQARMIQREPGSAREGEALACGKYIWLTLALSEAGLDIWQYEDKCYVWKFRELMTIMIIAMEKRRMEPSEAGLDGSPPSAAAPSKHHISLHLHTARTVLMYFEIQISF